ncbi:hypothetical protein RYX36_012858, partial [Vicia faba]
MTFSKLLLSSLLLSLLILHLVHAQQIDCNGACAARCRLASRQHLCHRACGTCCRRCDCVPPGTSGGQE